MLNEKLVKFCNENFDDGKLILNKLFEYKKILIKENESMNLIGKSTIDDLDERHLLDCIQIVKYLPHHEKSLDGYWNRCWASRNNIINYRF